jgi:CHASE2 domain-containing sensor protein
LNPSTKKTLLAILALFLLAVGTIQPWFWLNRNWQDFLSKRAPSLASSGDVVVVAIDEDVISRVGPWPWDRGQTGKLFETIASLHPKVLGFDGYFPHREISTVGDARLDSSLARIGASGVKVVLPFLVEGVGASDTQTDLEPLPPPLATSAFQLLQDKPGLERSGLGRGRKLIFSDTIYQRHSVPSGFINNPTDPEDGVCRHMIHALRVGQEYMPSFAVALVAAYGDATLADVSLQPGLIQVRRTQVLTNDCGMSPLRYLGTSSATSSIPAGDLLEHPEKYARRIKGKIVIVGLTSPAGVNAESGDFIRTPVDIHYPGVDLWATSVENILHGQVPRSTPLMRFWELLLGLAGCVGIWWLSSRRTPDQKIVAVAGVALFAVVAIQAILDRILSVQSAIDLPLAGLVLGMAGARVFRCPQSDLAGPATLASPGTVAGQATNALLPDHASQEPGIGTDGQARIGRFEIHGELGRGAMGVVYKGFDAALERHVAIKVLSAARRMGENQEENQSRFQREARSIAQLNHPSIVTIFEYGQWEGASYIAMELLDGPALDKLLLELRLPWKAVRAWGMQLLEALSFAHARDVIHRDIKPANVMTVDQGRRVKLTDFGLAGNADSSLTQEGQILGTPYYMAPELIDGKKGDARSDEYALGVVFYEMLSRRRPFEGDEVRQIMLQILMHPAPSLEGVVSQDVPPEVLAVIDRMMAKKPEDRYFGASEALEAWKRLPV